MRSTDARAAPAIAQNPRQRIEEALARAVREALPDADAPMATVERPRDASHGDYATSVALALAKPAKRNPRDLAAAIAAALGAALPGLVEPPQVAGPGFINITLEPGARRRVVTDVLAAGDRYGESDARAGERVIVEFVSANPTGPLHVGHGRQAALGDAIANLLEAQGASVTREFYYNDAGVQIQNLALSVQARTKGIKPGDPGWPEDAYQGEYVQDIATDFLACKTV